MKLVFMGTSEFAVPALEALHSSKHDILRVFTKHPSKSKRGQKLQKSPVHEAAEKLKLPTSTPGNLQSQPTLDELKSLDADIIIVVSYGHILRKKVLEMYKYGCLNIHPSLLPKWRGAAPIERTILSGDRKTALCIMQMDAGVDTGDILISEEVEISKNETSGTLHKKMSSLGSKLIIETLDNYTSLSPIKQSTEGVTYAEKLSKEDSKINWQYSAEKIDRMIRTFNPYPGCTFMLGTEQIKIFEAECRFTLEHGSKPGTILDKNFTIACEVGTLMPSILQRPGKKAMHIKDFLNGIKITPGDIVS
jgi:methionyl-tRNA formyltransferase